MENNERLNEINNSEVEKLLIGKIREIYTENKERFIREGIDLVDISMAKVDGKVIYEVVERDRDGNDRKSYYGGDAKYILTDSSKYGIPIFSTKGLGSEYSKNPEAVNQFLDKFESNKEISAREITNNKYDKARIDAIANSINVNSNDIDITEYNVKDIQDAKLKIDNINKSNLLGEFKGNEALTHHDSLNSMLGGNYDKILFAKDLNNRVVAYGSNERGELTPIQLKQFPNTQYKTNVMDRDGVIRENVSQTGIYISGMQNIDEGLSVNINQFGKFEITYNRNMLSKNPIGAVIANSRSYNNDKMMKLLDRYYVTRDEIEEDNRMVNSCEDRSNHLMKSDLIATDSDIYLKNGVLDPEVSRRLYHELNGNMDEFNNIVKLAKANVIDSKQKDAKDLIDEYEGIIRRPVDRNQNKDDRQAPEQN